MISTRVTVAQPSSPMTAARTAGSFGASPPPCPTPVLLAPQAYRADRSSSVSEATAAAYSVSASRHSFRFVPATNCVGSTKSVCRHRGHDQPRKTFARAYSAIHNQEGYRRSHLDGYNYAAGHKTQCHPSSASISAPNYSIRDIVNPSPTSSVMSLRAVEDFRSSATGTSLPSALPLAIQPARS